MTDTSLWHPFADMHAVRGAEFVLERGEDVWVYDTGGKRYLDATASLWYSNIGHGRPEIAAAIAAQLGKLEAYGIFGNFANVPAKEVAARVASYAPMADAKVFLTSGGGDSIETAAKIARRYWNAKGEPERTHLISRTQSYHGTHGVGTGIAGIGANRDGFGEFIREAERVAHDDPAALRKEIERIGPEKVAAFFAEPVIGAGGVIPPAPGYLEATAAIAREYGVLFVADEVICGYGRLGRWFGIERFGVTPDLITFAKGVTSGYLPLGGVIASAEVAAPFWDEGGRAFRHGATYAGHPTCCAAALANLDILEQDNLVTRGEQLEKPLYEALRSLADHPAVAEVRGGVGLLAAVELHPDTLAANPAAVAAVGAHARDESGVLLRTLNSSLAVSPPLTATEEHFRLIRQAFDAALDSL
ncbi:aspartate aminotransferase family protein [Fodinicola acaciae]|uniref:aminotransferase family protein n=1 Tax=Fodinicola acaciae TaxID=2681555 RepID=UPI001FEAF6E8|nr:aspartate aminotransferase family protein [Fodinicola acaciae]